MSIISEIKIEKYKNMASIINCVAVVLGIVGLIFAFISNAVPGYGIANFGLALLALILGLLASIATLIFEPILGSQNLILSLCKLIAVAGLIIGVAIILIPTIESASALFTWDNENTVGWSAFTSAVVSVVCFIVADIALIVTSFFKEDAE